MMKTFVEICLYEVKAEKTEEFEALIQRVQKHHTEFPGVITVRYMKRTHRPVDFLGVKQGKPAIRLTRKQDIIIYALYWELKDERVHAKATCSGRTHFFKNFRRCLLNPPKIILGREENGTIL